MWKPTPELTWHICQGIFWAACCWTIYCNYADCVESTISAVLAKKATENYWIPAILLAVYCHWFWAAPR